ncbi:MAG: dihydroorotate dehydrogenase [Flavobacteriales bacterium]|nr:dihydroorotate dehydrogenase [Flavobacteriales bacterium]
MLKVKLKDITFDTPILVASGTYGYGNEVEGLADVSKLGGIITKSVTRLPREGNPPPRITETAAGMLNSIGLANLGVEAYCKEKIPFLNELDTKIIINVAGTAMSDYIETFEMLENHGGNHVGYEINISCPNVKEGGMEFGVSPKMTEQLTKELRSRTDRILIMKLSPNVTRIQDIGLAAEAGGADAVSAINTVVGMGIDVKKRKVKLHTIYGGLSGPAIKPVALACVHKLNKVLSIPIIGLGGISTAEDVLEFILAGADLVQVGTINYKHPSRGMTICDDLIAFCKENNMSNILELQGQLDK